MSYLKITDLSLETNLTQSEVNSVVGGWGTYWGPNWGSKGKDPVYRDKIYQAQSLASVAQGSNGVGDNLQINSSNIEVFFL